MRSTIDDLNYLNDHRVRARDRRPWYISTGCPSGSSTEGHPTHVAVQVPTADYKWLVDHGYDTDEGPVRPMITAGLVPGDQACYRCAGEGSLHRHREWKGIAEPAGRLLKSHPNLSLDDCDVVECWICKGSGKDPVWKRLDEPRLDPDAEDRVYFPFRVVAFPCKWVECPTCDGRGRHVNPSIDAGGLTRSDFDEDPDLEEEYFSGVYDVTCYECHGQRKVPAIDVHALAPEERRDYETWATWRAELAAEEAAYLAERMAEMRMGC